MQENQGQSAIRNFAIIAHIDHGKTTLTDRLLEHTTTIAQRELTERFLDSNPIERERGITIKLAPVRMFYTLDARRYTLNLIDTPGHVDFSYEVSRSLSACEGVILLIDATQGIQAQTLAHAREAINLGLTLIPTLNKIDLTSARVDQTLAELKEVFGIKNEEVSRISAKTGQGIKELLRRIAAEIPHPQGKEASPLRALIFNSIYDTHLGVIAFVRIVDGSVRTKQELRLIASGREVTAKEIGVFSPKLTPAEILKVGEVGYIATGLKDIHAIKVGDTITQRGICEGTLPQPLPGFKIPNPTLFADFFPEEKTTFEELKEAAQKLQLTDASLTLKSIHQPALGSGLRFGFLGLFHSEITRERLRREQGISIIPTKPTVEYLVEKRNGETVRIQNPSELPDTSEILKIEEPVVKVSVFTPREYIGALMQLFEERRGKYQNIQYFGQQAQMIYELPFIELVDGFVDIAKSRSQGYASLDYEQLGQRPVDAVKLSVLINHQLVEPLSRIVVRDKAQAIAHELVAKLKEVLPRQQFAVPIQASLGGNIIARETKPAVRKDVTAKLYGGDQTRKDKLLTKQKQGKKKLAKLGQVTIPADTFIRIMQG